MREAAQRTLTFLQGPARAVRGPVLQIRYGRVGKPELFDDEKYSLRVTPMGVAIMAPTSLGVLHALATLQQLPVGTGKARFLPEVDITDQPRFAWRGLLIDAARHFMPVPVIKRNIDGMAAVKLNVLHWHLTDDQGFRAESKTLPRLHEVGGADGFYTQQEIKDVLAYAAARGIRVVPEFDVPSHTISWIAAYPQLASDDKPYEVYRSWRTANVAIDPTRESTYALLDTLFGEMTALFPDPYFHIGGDENDGRQWRGSSRIMAYAKENKMLKSDGKTLDQHKLQTYFNRRVLAMLEKYGKTMVGWDEVLGPDLPTEVVVQSWTGTKGLVKAVQAGHRTLLSNGYYLDLNHTAASHYATDPLPPDTPLSAAQQRLILGGEATMWAEFADSVMIDSRIWPRAGAVAERLWSPQAAAQDVPDMYRRLTALAGELDALGLRNRRAPVVIISQLAGIYDPAPLRVLAEVLEPVKDYKRHFQGLFYTPQTPLKRLVDAAPAESETARQFAATVDSLLAGAPGGQLKRTAATAGQLLRLRQQLILWQANNARLQPLLLLNESLHEYAPHSVHLTEVAALLLERLAQLEKSQSAPTGWSARARAALDAAQAPAGQAELALIPAARRLAGVE